MEKFRLAQIKEQGKYSPYDPTDTTRGYAFVLRNGKQCIRNYGRELKNGKGLTAKELCDMLNYMAGTYQGEK